MPEVRNSGGWTFGFSLNVQQASELCLCLQPLSCVLFHFSRQASGLISLQGKINPQSHSSPTASSHFSRWIVFQRVCCPHLPLAFSMVERSGRVPSAHESGYCIIFCHRLTSSPTESISTSSFPIITLPAGVNITKLMQN